MSEKIPRIRTNEPIYVLAVLSDNRLRRTLDGILSHSTWTCRFVTTWSDAIAALQEAKFGVVVTEREIEGGFCWKDFLRRTHEVSPNPRLIVTDPLADDRLWAEVINLGAYDVLVEPLELDEVFRILSLAWLSWREECKREASHAAA